MHRSTPRSARMSFLIEYERRTAELSRVAAIGVVRSLKAGFEGSTDLNYDGMVSVRLDGADSNGIRECFMESCVNRELRMVFDRSVLLIGASVGLKQMWEAA